MRQRSKSSLSVVGAGLLLGLGCGPEVGNETGSMSTGSSSAGSAGPGSGSIDDTGTPMVGACGEFDTEIVGGGPPGPLGYPDGCSPQTDPGINGYRCCSDDPAAVGGLAPDYEGKNISNSGVPYFSGPNNGLSTSGQCIRVDDLPDQGLVEEAAAGCPIPCNPTWSDVLVTDVCGPARACCQTRPLEPEDCIMDPSTGLFRPVTGDDIGELSMWRPADHATHQDPNGTSCLALAGGDANSDTFVDCVRQLSVADQRGFCVALPAGGICPAADPSYVDACAMLNEG